jgi:hypothetical protein
MKLKITITFFLIIILLGCIEPTRGELNFCVYLTSKSYDNIPKCNSEAACYAHTEKLFDSTNFSYEQQNNLYTFKNHLARSWYFFNLGTKESEKLSNLCKNENIIELPGTINQTRFYFDSAFQNLDYAIKESFKIIDYEEKLLTYHEIDLIKEEELYNNLVETRQIMSELENGKTNSGSYVSYYFDRVNNFEKTVKNRHFENIVEEKPIWLKVYDLFGGNLIETMKKNAQIESPLLGSIFKNSIDIIQLKIDYDNSINALINFPIYDLMKLYSDTGGIKDSVIKRFSDLITRINNNRKIMEKNKLTLWEKVNKNIENCQTYYEQSKLTNAFPLIKEKTNTLIEEKNLEKKLNNLKKQYFSLKELVSRNELSIGKEFYLLKEIFSNGVVLERELLISGNSLIENMTKYCNTKSIELSKTTKNFDSIELTNLWRNILFFSEKTTITTGNEKLTYCEKMIKENEFLILAEKDYELYHAKKIDLSANCFQEIEEIFKYYSNYELKLMFDKLKNTEVNAKNFSHFETACENILNQLKLDIKSEQSIKEILNKYTHLSKLKNSFSDLCLEDKQQTKNCENLNILFNEYSKYFNSDTPNYSKILPIKFELLNNIENSYNEYNEKYILGVIDYIINNSKIIILNDTIPKTNTFFETTHRFIINNPFTPINRNISINFSGGKKLIEKDPPIERILFEEGIIFLKNVPNGITKFDYISEVQIKTTEETIPISITNDKSIYQRTISINSDKILPNLLITTKKPKGTSKTILLINEKEVIFSDDTNISFIGKNVSKQTKISLFFYINDLINLKKTHTKTTLTGINSEKITYLIEAKNNTHEKFTNVSLIIPLEINKLIKKTELINILDGVQKIKTYSESIVLNNQTFLPNEIKQYYLTLEINNPPEYYNLVLTELKQKLINLGEFGEAKNADKLINSEYSTNLQKEIETFIKSTENLIKKHEKKLEEDQLIFSAKLILEQKINELYSMAQTLEEYGFYDDSKKLFLETSSAKKILENGNLKEINMSFEKLNKYSFNPSKIIHSKVEKMWENLQQIKETNPALTQEITTFFEKKQALDELITNPLESKKIFDELNEFYLTLLQKNKEFEKTIQENELKNQFLLDSLFLEIEEKIIFLEKELSVNETDLINAKFIQPITISRLNKISLEIPKIKISKKNINEKIIILTDFLNELNDAIDSIQLQTINRFNEMIDMGENDKILSEAKKYIDLNNFTTALIILGSSELTDPNPLYFQLINFIPIIIIILIAFILKTKIKKQKTNEKQEQEKVINDWDD